MSNFKRSFVFAFFPVILGVLGPLSSANAAPFTDHFDELITDLVARAGVLSNSTDKVEQKQFKAIQKVLKTLNGKTSTSLATDIKNLGGVAKTLVKSFPADFIPPGSSMVTNLQTAADEFLADVQSQIDTTKSNIDALAVSSCKIKAQDSANNAQTQLDEATAAPDFASGAKLLGKALKTAIKAASSAVNCTSQGGGGGGGGGNNSVSATFSGAISHNFSASTGNGFVLAQYNQTMRLITITAGQMQNNTTVTHSMALYADLVDGPDTYPIDFASGVFKYDPITTFFGASGTISFTTADIPGQKLVGTFAFTEPQQIPVGTGTVSVTGGQFNINSIIRNDSTPRNNNVMIAEDNRFSFYGPCNGTFIQVGNALLLTGQNEALTYRTLTLVVQNPSGPGAYPVALGSNYFDQRGILYTNSPAGTVYFSTLNVGAGLAEGTFTCSIGAVAPNTNIVNVINGYFKNSNIVTQ